MAARNVKGHKILFVSMIVSIFILMIWEGAFAKIPEPDNIIYGIAGEGVGTVSLKINGQEIATYTMGDNPDAGAFYILRVPLDSLDPPQPDAAHVGDEAEIFIDDETVAAATVTIGDRGSIQKIHLSSVDADGDGLPDAEEDYWGTNPGNPDTDGDHLSDGDEINSLWTKPLSSDSDGDGYSDNYETGAGTNANDKDAFPAIYVDAANTSGTEDGSVDYPYNTIGEGIAAAPDMYTVLVAPGTYPEAVTIAKDIRLRGDSAATTLIDGGGAANAVSYNNDSAFEGGIEGFTITNADNGINCTDGTLVIRNTVISGVETCGVACANLTTVRIINNTITDNPNATGICALSSSLKIVNNIISDNGAGIDCNGSSPSLDYNDLWNNTGGDYGSCVSGEHDISLDPVFVDLVGGDFHLSVGSPCLDAGDPVEILSSDYLSGLILSVDAATNLETNDRVWLTDGINTETDLLDALTDTTVQVRYGFMNPYLTADAAYLFSDTSDASREPAPGDGRVDMGAYGNTEDAGPMLAFCDGDLEPDGDVDGADLAVLSGHADIASELPAFAADYGKTDCAQ